MAKGNGVMGIPQNRNPWRRFALVGWAIAVGLAAHQLFPPPRPPADPGPQRQGGYRYRIVDTREFNNLLRGWPGGMEFDDTPAADRSPNRATRAEALARHARLLAARREIERQLERLRAEGWEPCELPLALLPPALAERPDAMLFRRPE